MPLIPPGEPNSLRCESLEVGQISDSEKRNLDRDFCQFKRQFLRTLARERRSELRKGGLTASQIQRMRRGFPPRRGRIPWEVHHVVPRRITAFLQNANACANLCLLPRTTHRILHEFIDPQVEGMEPGQSRIVLLPIPFHPILAENPNRIRARLQKVKEANGLSEMKSQEFPALSRWTSPRSRSPLPLLSPASSPTKKSFQPSFHPPIHERHP